MTTPAIAQFSCFNNINYLNKYDITINESKGYNL